MSPNLPHMIDHISYLPYCRAGILSPSPPPSPSLYHTHLKVLTIRTTILRRTHFKHFSSSYHLPPFLKELSSLIKLQLGSNRIQHIHPAAFRYQQQDPAHTPSSIQLPATGYSPYIQQHSGTSNRIQHIHPAAFMYRQEDPALWYKQQDPAHSPSSSQLQATGSSTYCIKYSTPSSV